MKDITRPLGTVGLLLDSEPCANDGMWEATGTSDHARRHPVARATQRISLPRQS